MPIIGIFESGVFLYCAGICEMNPIPLGHQQINQPVQLYVDSNGDISDVVSERPQGIDYDRWIIRELSVKSSFAVLVNDSYITVT